VSTPAEGEGFLHELEVEVRDELRLAESSRPAEAAELPVTEWLFDPEDAERDRAGLQGLLGAVQALEDDAEQR
jgi:hypothetical protein